MSSDPQLCSLCPKMCRFACPVAEGSADEGATPTAMMQAWELAKDGQLPWEDAADAFSKCTGCEACRAPCEYGQDVPAMLYAARAEAWEKGAVPAQTREMHQRYLDSGTPFGIDTNAVLREHCAPEDFQRKGRVLYWPGCRSVAEQPGTVAATMRVLRALGADHVSLPARKDLPGCCGAPLRAAGDQTGLQVAAAGLQQYFNRQRTWVSPDPGCLHTVREGYPDAGTEINAEVLHLAEYLLFFEERLTELGKQACAVVESGAEPWPAFVVHDACALSRRLGRGEPVRQVVEALTGVEPGCWGASPDRTQCCGAGDFHDLRRPEAAAQVAASARPDLPANAWVITGDPGCRTSLEATAGGARVMDVAGFLEAWLGPVVA